VTLTRPGWYSRGLPELMRVLVRAVCASGRGTRQLSSTGNGKIRQSLMPETIDAFQRDGVVVIRGLFVEYVNALRAGVSKNMQSPGPHASENTKPGETGRFFDDYCNWQRIPEFVDVVRSSEAGAVAAALMGSGSAQLFHEHVLVKEAGTSRATPWHTDEPYYNVTGDQTVSFWSPLDPVREASLRCVAGSHLWPKPVLPTRWLSEASFYPDPSAYMPVPDPDAEGMCVLEWGLEPGDAVAFSFKTLHGARGNESAERRRVFSLRFVGDDVRVVERPGPSSPPWPGHGMLPGERLREDWFPTIWPRRAPQLAVRYGGVSCVV